MWSLVGGSVLEAVEPVRSRTWLVQISHQKQSLKLTLTSGSGSVLFPGLLQEDVKFSLQLLWIPSFLALGTHILSNNDPA